MQYRKNGHLNLITRFMYKHKGRGLLWMYVLYHAYLISLSIFFILIYTIVVILNDVRDAPWARVLSLEHLHRDKISC